MNIPDVILEDDQMSDEEEANAPEDKPAFSEEEAAKPYDVVFVCDDTEFPAHKSILAAASPYFHAMFHSGFREVDSKSVPLPGIDCRAMKVVLDHIYRRQLTITDQSDLLVKVYEAAHFLNLKSLLNDFHTVTTKDNVNVMWDLAEAYSHAVLLKTVKRFIDSKLFPPTDVGVLLSLSYDRLVPMLRTAVNFMRLSPIEIFRYLLDWIFFSAETRYKYMKTLSNVVSLDKIPSFFLKCHLYVPMSGDSAPSIEDKILLIFIEDGLLFIQEAALGQRLLPPTTFSTCEQKDKRPNFLTKSPLKAPVTRETAIVLNIGKDVYLIRNDASGRMLAWVYDLVTLQWRHRPAGAKKRYLFREGARVSGTAIGKVIYVVGMDHLRSNCARMLKFDPTADVWETESEYEHSDSDALLTAKITSAEDTLYLAVTSGTKIEWQLYDFCLKQFLPTTTSPSLPENHTFNGGVVIRKSFIDNRCQYQAMLDAMENLVI